MSESLLDDLQYVQLMVKEHHRRKRAIHKLNKTKRHNLNGVKENNSKYGEWYQRKHNKHFHIYLEYEIKSINDCIYNNDIWIDIEEDIITTTNTPNNSTKNTAQKHEILVLDSSDTDDTDNESENDISLSTCFEAIEYDIINDESENVYLEFPSQFLHSFASLYSPSDDIQSHIDALLKSVRYWNVSRTDIHSGIEGQAVIIGSHLNELICTLHAHTLLSECPIDIIYIISELVGNAIVWLRKPGLNILKWSPKERKTFYFSGYIDCQSEYCLKLKEILLNDTNDYTQYLDLDWCFVVFLLLGLIPNQKNQYFRWYFNQKLLSAFADNYPFQLLLKT